MSSVKECEHTIDMWDGDMKTDVFLHEISGRLVVDHLDYCAAQNEIIALRKLVTDQTRELERLRNLMNKIVEGGVTEEVISEGKKIVGNQ